MSILKLSAAALLISSVAYGQGQMPLPDYTSTYSTPNGTRGFYFQAPAAFTITGLRVPDEMKSGTQNVAVYRLAAKPGSNVSSKPIFFQAGTKSSVVIATNLVFKKNEWVVVLGCGGTSTVQHNSYGAGSYSSKVLGAQVVLNRIWTNTNLIKLKGGGAFNAALGSIGRVEVYIKGQRDGGRAVDFGKGSTNKRVGNPYMGIPAFNRTYGDSRGYPRGFYFQAPSNFAVTGLRVPNEANASLQVVSLFTMAKEPPAFPGSVAVGKTDLKYFSSGTKAGLVIPARAVITKGTWVGVLGATYNAATKGLNHSYGKPIGPYKSVIMGSAVTIKRLIMQAPLLTNKGLGPVARDEGAPIARVEIHIAGQSTFPSLTTKGRPGIGLTPVLQVEGLPGSQTSLLLLGIGRMSAPLPTIFGKLLIKPPFYLTVPVAGGTGKVPMPIPNDNALLGGVIDWQALDLNVTTTTYGLSNGTEWKIGM